MSDAEMPPIPIAWTQTMPDIVSLRLTHPIPSCGDVVVDMEFVGIDDAAHAAAERFWTRSDEDLLGDPRGWPARPAT